MAVKAKVEEVAELLAMLDVLASKLWCIYEVEDDWHTELHLYGAGVGLAAARMELLSIELELLSIKPTAEKGKKKQ